MSSFPTIASLCVVLSGCCVGESGADYSRAGKTCSEWLATDSTIVRAMKDRLSEFRPNFADGYWVKAQKTESWYSEMHGVEIAGYADCSWKVIVVGSSAPSQGGLAHELIHSLIACEYLPEEADGYHIGWHERGFYKLIDCVRAGSCEQSGN